MKFSLPAHPVEAVAGLWVEEKRFGLGQPLEDGQKWETSAEARRHRCTWGAAPAVPTCPGKHIWPDVDGGELGSVGAARSWRWGWQVLTPAAQPGNPFCAMGNKRSSNESCAGHSLQCSQCTRGHPHCCGHCKRQLTGPALGAVSLRSCCSFRQLQTEL